MVDGYLSSSGSPEFGGESESIGGRGGENSKRFRFETPTSSSSSSRRRAPFSPNQRTSPSCRWDGDCRRKSPRLVEAPEGYENYRATRKPLGKLVAPSSDDEREERLGLRGTKVRPVMLAAGVGEADGRGINICEEGMC